MSWLQATKDFFWPRRYEVAALAVRAVSGSKAPYHLKKLEHYLGEFEAIKNLDNWEPGVRDNKKRLQRALNSRRDLLLTMGLSVPLDRKTVRKLLEEMNIEH